LGVHDDLPAFPEPFAAACTLATDPAFGWDTVAARFGRTLGGGEDPRYVPDNSEAAGGQSGQLPDRLSFFA
jgi:hypothetical protein